MPEKSNAVRLYPAQSSRLYYHLTCLRKAVERVIEIHLSSLEQPCVLDYGCGDMPYRPLFENVGATYEGHDLDRNELADYEIASDGKLARRSASVDVVLSSQVLEHVESPDSYLAESHRVLKSSGLMVLSTHGVWRYHPDPNDYWRWTGAGLRKIIKQAGFEILDFQGIMGPSATAIQLWQDANLARVPQFLRSTFCRVSQIQMRRADARCSPFEINNDASVFLCVARKS